MPNYTITPIGTAITNTAVIDSDGLVKTFLQYVSPEWALDAGVELSQNGDVVTCSVNPNGASNAATQIILDNHAVDYTTKTLSIVETFLVDYLSGVYSDFIQATEAMCAVVDPMIAGGSWTNGDFSDNDKQIIVKWNCVEDPTKILGVYPNILDRMAIQKNHYEMLRQSRQDRYSAMRSKIAGGLEAMDAMEAIHRMCGILEFTNNFGDTGKWMLEDHYRDEGGISFAVDGSYGIYDYLDTTFRGSAYVPITGQTLTDFTDDLLDILLNGNY